MTKTVFHLAIPCLDLDQTKEFYVDQLGCRLARRYDDRITLQFFENYQIVCHLSDESEVPDEVKMYPRHFGMTFQEKFEFDSLHDVAVKKNLPFFRNKFVRFEGMKEEHHTFFLIDPAKNLLEFKYYFEPEMIY